MRYRVNGFFFLVVFLLLLMVSLGFWQLARYHDKKRLMDQYHRNITAPALDWQAFLVHKPVFQAVHLAGYYVGDKTLLLDNRWYHGRLGYEVLTPFKTVEENKYLLVNRGWVPADKSRTVLPLINTPIGEQHLRGYVVIPSEKGFMLGENIESLERWPIRIQRIIIPDVSRVTGLVFYPYVLHLFPDNQPVDFVREWQLVNVTPARHFAYAIQWFVMSLVLVVAYWVFVRRSRARSD